MKLSELRRYLKAGKLRFVEEDCRHYHYTPSIDDAELILPTIIAVSKGDGEVPMKALKGVAEALGLTLKQLKDSSSCHIGRDCVLLMLAWRMLVFGVERQQDAKDHQLGEKALKAMVISVEVLVNDVKKRHKSNWNTAELKVFQRVTSKTGFIQPDPLDNPLSQTIAGAMLELMQ